MAELSRTLSAVRAFHAEERYEEAMRLIEDYQIDSELPAVLLLYKAALIELSSRVEPGSVERAKECYLKAVELEPANVVVLTEVGWFYLNVMDDVKEALSYFDKALSTSSGQIREVVGAIQQCLDELNIETNSTQGEP